MLMMNRLRRVTQGGVLTAMAALLSACASPGLEDYADARPALVPQRFFNGELEARGIVRDYRGRVIRTFDATLQGVWSAQGHGELRERFVFDDGEVQYRTWRFTPRADGALDATAEDVAEPGVLRWAGNALHMNYVLRIPWRDGTLDVRMDDWMHAVTPDTVINQTAMSKFGLPVGQVVLVIRQLPSRAQRTPAL